MGPKTSGKKRETSNRALPHKIPAGRQRQRERTRGHIVSVVKELLRAGDSPSMADIAAASGVARRTLYLHFPTLEHLLIDARLGLLSESSIDAAIAKADTDGDAESRVMAMIDAICTNAQETLPLGRALIRLTVESGGQQRSGKPVRGYRRIGWIERALEPLRDRLKKGEFERLVSSLAVIIGWEGMIVLFDVRGLPAEQVSETTRWAARAIIRTTLQNATTRLRASKL